MVNRSQVSAAGALASNIEKEDPLDAVVLVLLKVLALYRCATTNVEELDFMSFESLGDFIR
jgi:hypothetical protein